MTIKVERGSVPLPGPCSAHGVLPEHFVKNDITIEYTDGSLGLACHVKTDGSLFPLYVIVGGDRQFNAIVLTQLSYVNETGVTEIRDITKQSPMLFRDDPKFTFGYATKLNNLRWGVTLHIDNETGRAQFVTDHGSPVVGAMFRLTNI